MGSSIQPMLQPCIDTIVFPLSTSGYPKPSLQDINDQIPFLGRMKQIHSHNLCMLLNPFATILALVFLPKQISCLSKENAYGRRKNQLDLYF